MQNFTFFKSVILLLLCCSSIFAHQKFRHKRNIVFPKLSLYGIFAAIALPIDIPDKNVFISYNFEGNYHVPANSTELGDMAFLAPITEIRMKRQINRKFAYRILEDKISRSGFHGRSCLLRIICEASQMDLDGNGVLGHVLQIILTPSYSIDENLPTKFYMAEKRGRHGRCDEYNSKCPESFLDKISKVL